MSCQSVIVPASAQRSFVFQLAVFGVVFYAAGQLVAAIYGVHPPKVFTAFAVLFLAAVGFGGAFALVGYVLWLAYKKEPDPVGRVRAIPYAMIATRVAPAAIVFLTLGTFGSFKCAIPYIKPFYLDAALSDLDRMMFGADPWRITHAVIGPIGTRVIDVLYGLWFPAWSFALIYFGCFAKAKEQRQFIISFLLVWIILGFVAAVALSSAGPCFLGLLHHPYADRYAGLLPLNGAPGATAAQAMLEQSYRSGDIGAFKGISAMPSVHVGVAALLVMAAWNSKRWFVPSVLLYFVIMVGSVHLGWHYVSDGIVATVGAGIIWWAVAAFERLRLERDLDLTSGTVGAIVDRYRRCPD